MSGHPTDQQVAEARNAMEERSAGNKSWAAGGHTSPALAYDMRQQAKAIDTLLAHVDKIEAENKRLKAALRVTADDLESELLDRYDGVRGHPTMERKFERDMETVVAARRALSSTGASDD